jgi:hypothetical protein
LSLGLRLGWGTAWVSRLVNQRQMSGKFSSKRSGKYSSNCNINGSSTRSSKCSINDSNTRSGKFSSNCSNNSINFSSSCNNNSINGSSSNGSGNCSNNSINGSTSNGSGKCSSNGSNKLLLLPLPSLLGAVLLPSFPLPQLLPGVLASVLCRVRPLTTTSSIVLLLRPSSRLLSRLPGMRLGLLRGSLLAVVAPLVLPVLGIIRLSLRSRTRLPFTAWGRLLGGLPPPPRPAWAWLLVLVVLLCIRLLPPRCWPSLPPPRGRALLGNLVVSRLVVACAGLTLVRRQLAQCLACLSADWFLLGKLGCT